MRVDPIRMVGIDDIRVVRLDRVAHHLADEIQVVPMDFLGQDNFTLAVRLSAASVS